MWGSAGGNWLRIGVVPAGEDVMDRYLEGRRARLMSDGVCAGDLRRLIGLVSGRLRVGINLC